jgi:IS30 family transposase
MANHLTIEDRDRIAELFQGGAQQADIAVALGRSRATICRELSRNRTDAGYYSGQAQQQAEARRRERPLVRKLDDPQLNQFVRSKLTQEWAPEQIAGRLKQEDPDALQCRVSAQTIYAWIEQDENRPHWQSFLRRRGKRPNRRKNTSETSATARIRNRPAIIENRLRLGDFEGDTVLGPPGTGGLATLVCRKSRFTIIVKIQSKDADHVHQKLKERLRELDDEHRRSITFDNGTEFARCHRLEKHLDMKLYFADPGCPYQRGTNENTNGLIRQYFPKGTDFRDISHAAVREAEKRINNRPRACLGFRTTTEVFFEKNPTASCV